VAVARPFRGALGDAATAIATLAEGWAWMAAYPDGRRVVQFLVAADAVPGRAHLTVLHERLLEALPDAVAWVDGAAPEGEAVARDATPVLRAGLVGPDHLRVGDAAFATDPLSGHGVFEAMGGAFAAAAAINTLLSEPAALPLVRAFVEGRAKAIFEHHARTGRAFYQAEGRWPDAPFWRERAAWPPGADPLGTSGVRRQPVVVDDRIVEREVLFTPRHPRGVLAIDGVELAPLLRAGDAVGGAAAGAAMAWLRMNRFLNDEGRAPMREARAADQGGQRA
jgi:hypothetical protein